MCTRGAKAQLADTVFGEQQAGVQVIAFGKGQRFTGEASQALAQGVEPALDMRRLPGLLVHRVMPSSIKDTLIGCPAIAERGTATIVSRHTTPRVNGTVLRAIS